MGFDKGKKLIREMI